MVDKTKSSRILLAVHETASGLHRLGLIGDTKMRKYDALCREDAEHLLRNALLEGASSAPVGIADSKYFDGLRGKILRRSSKQDR